MTSSNEIRQKFLNYFEKQNHTIVPSSGLVPDNDPTLLFTNSGMVQFKNLFTGAEKRDYKRAVSSQRCLRAGGKHNDLENVGYTARHHTFFEMLGNFSFGDYFKEDAIKYCWDMLTKDFDLPKEKLIATVYAEDEEAYQLWQKIAGLPSDRIIKISTSDNFWSMGDTGPCGPCTEIFYDHGDKIPGGLPGTPEEDGDRFIEIWNLVFMQYEQLANGKRIDLPKQSVDTGMGLERLAAILQGKHDNYDIDLFRHLIENSAHMSNTDPDGDHKISHRVIADHLRASSFLIVDGVLPSNEGRGYVLRRIMRRAMRHAHHLGCDEPHMHKLVQSLVDQMGEHYPELKRGQALVEETLLSEEKRFKKTLSRGLKLLDEELDNMGSQDVLPGKVAFKLYDTYGFPVDLTQDILRGHGKSIDQEGFDKSMEAQKEEARKSWVGSGESTTESHWFGIRQKFGATAFLGYKKAIAEAAVLVILKDGEQIDAITDTSDEIEFLTNQTPFYAESGGQVGDVGLVSGPDGLKVEVFDTQKKVGDLFVHRGRVLSGKLAVGDFVEMAVDQKMRLKTAANHSATHLFHAALRNAMGEQVTQKGSLVNPEKLRFDVSLNNPVEPQILREIEEQVNEIIIQNTEVSTKLMPVKQAIEAGAMALFGEKYGDEVRVVTMGHDEDTLKNYSVELCGGIHVKQTGDIGCFKIISQAALSSGVRRFEAITGLKAVEYNADQELKTQKVAAIMKVSPNDVVERAQGLASEKKSLEREVADLRRQVSVLKASGAGEGGSASSEQAIKKISNISFISKVLEDVPSKDLKPLVDDLKTSLKSGIAAVISVQEGKASLVIGVTEDLTASYNAVDLVKSAAILIGGKGGGGRPDMAQAGGPDGAAANKAIADIEAKILEMTG